MKKWLLYLLLLLLPFVGMIVTNECVRFSTNEIGYNKQGVVAINSGEKYKRQCSWACHNNTNHCKANHVKLAKPYFDTIDPIYFGIINALQSTGNYRWANIVFLVFLLPLLMYILLIKSIGLQIKIRQQKKKR